MTNGVRKHLMPKDYYKILGVDKNASEDDIKKSFRRLAHEHHPDKGGDTQKFKDINEAYQVLGDKQKRAKYDQFGSAAFDNNGFGGAGAQGFGDFGFGGFGGAQGFNVNMDDFGDLGDVLGGMFGFGGGGRGRTKRGSDLEAELQIEFLESVFGVDKELRVYKHDKCTRCSGSGADPGSKTVTCATCQGKGRVQQAQRTILGTFNAVVTCPDCGGRGQKAEKHCVECHGTGVKKNERTLVIKVPAGISNGEGLKVTGEGEYPGPGGKSGDLYVRIKVKPHATFKRQDHDVISEMRVPFSLLVLGGKIDVATVDGDVTLKIPDGTAAATVFKLRGKGVPYMQGYGRGDHLVTLLPHVPDKLTREQKKILEDLKGLGM